MRIRHLIPALASTLLLAAHPAAAQTSSQSGTLAPAGGDTAIRTQLKSDLRNLVTAQEAYYAEHSAYAASISELKFSATIGSQIALTVTQNNSWAGAGSVATWPGKNCVIYVNVATKYQPKTMVDKRTGGDGQPVCDGDPAP